MIDPTSVRTTGINPPRVAAEDRVALGRFEKGRRDDVQVVSGDATIAAVVAGHRVELRDDAGLDLGRQGGDRLAPWRLVGVEGLGKGDLDLLAALGRRVDVDADERIGAGEVGDVEPGLELVARTRPSGRSDPKPATLSLFTSRPWRSAPERRVVAGERLVLVADHDHADPLRGKEVMVPLRDPEGHVFSA